MSIGPPLNPQVTDVGSPPIPEAQAWRERYDGSFGPLIDLSQAAPGSPPSDEFLRRLGEAAASPETAKYGPILGDPGLRRTFAKETARIYDAAVSADEIAVTAGCNMAFFASMMLLARAGDGVLLPTPWYFNHQMILAMLGIEARPLACRAKDGFVPTIAEAERIFDSNIKALVLVTPNNPTGAVYHQKRIEEFYDWCERKKIYLVIDETYRDFLPQDMSIPHRLFAKAERRKALLQLYSFSKSQAIPGHRVGTITAHASLIDQVAKILDCLQICPPRAAQSTLAWALPHQREWREANRREINRRAEHFRNVVQGLPRWTIDSMGAYFAYLRHPFENLSARDVAERLMIERGILTLPGSYFGPCQENHLRIAFANVSVDVLDQLTGRLQGFQA